MSLNFNQFAKDVKKFRSGKLKAEEFIAKYPDAFDENTKPELLPQDPDRLSAFFYQTVLGAKQAISRNKLANREIKEILGDDEDFKRVFNPSEYEMKEEIEDETSGEKQEITTYLQSPESIEKLAKNIFLVVGKLIDKKLEENTKYLEENNNTMLSSLKEEIMEETTKLLQTEAPKVSQEKSLENSFLKHLQGYIPQLVHSSPSLQEFIGSFKPEKEIDKTKNPNELSLEDIKKTIVLNALDKFKSRLAKGNTQFNVNTISLLTQSAITDLVAEHDFILKEAFPVYQLDWKPEKEEQKTDNKDNQNQTPNPQNNPQNTTNTGQVYQNNVYNQPQIPNYQPQQQVNSNPQQNLPYVNPNMVNNQQVPPQIQQQSINTANQQQDFNVPSLVSQEQPNNNRDISNTNDFFQSIMNTPSF